VLTVIGFTADQLNIKEKIFPSKKAVTSEIDVYHRVSICVFMLAGFFRNPCYLMLETSYSLKI
jgi:hypothetical protein